MRFQLTSHIVGIAKVTDLATRDVLLSEAIGKTVVLVCEPDNKYDSRAIRAIYKGSHIGYIMARDIRMHDLDHIIEGFKNHSLVVNIIGIDNDYHSLIVELPFCDYGHWDMSDYETYKAWEYNGNVFDPYLLPEVKDLRDTTLSLLALLEEEDPNSDDIKPLIERYVNLAEYGFSVEFYKDRSQIYQILSNSHNEDMKRFSRMMANASSYIHDSDVRNKALSRIMKELKRQAKLLSLEEQHKFSTNQLEQQLRIFPNGLYTKQKPIYSFASKVYYSFIPHNKLFEFLSGLAMVAVLGSSTKPSVNITKKKNKRGRPKKTPKKEIALYYRINTNGNKYDWIDYFAKSIEGKINEDAAAVFVAAMITGVMDSPFFNELEEAFGEIGNRNDFNPALRTLDETDSRVKRHIELINEAKKELDQKKH